MKKFICGLSAALLLTSLTACGNSKAEQPSEPAATPSAAQTEAPAPEPSKEPPTETATSEPSPVIEESTEPITTVPPSLAPVTTEPPAPTEAVPASVAPVATELPVSTQPTTTDSSTSGEGVETGPNGMPHGDNYVGEIPGMVYIFPFGYYPEGGNVQIIDGHMPNWNDVVGGD